MLGIVLLLIEEKANACAYTTWLLASCIWFSAISIFADTLLLVVAFAGLLYGRWPNGTSNKVHKWLMRYILIYHCRRWHYVTDVWIIFLTQPWYWVTTFLGVWSWMYVYHENWCHLSTLNRVSLCQYFEVLFFETCGDFSFVVPLFRKS